MMISGNRCFNLIELFCVQSVGFNPNLILNDIFSLLNTKAAEVFFVVFCWYMWFAFFEFGCDGSKTIVNSSKCSFLKNTANAINGRLNS